MESLEITLPFPPSVNGLFAGKARRYPSKAYKAWLKKCPALTCKSPWKTCSIIYTFYFPCKRLRDGQSYLKAATDYLVNQGVIEDDNITIVHSELWLNGGLDRDSPRVLIHIVPHSGVIADVSSMVSLANTLKEC